MEKNSLSDEITIDNKLTAMLAEYQMLRTEMRMFHDDSRKDMQAFLTIVVTLTTVYFSNIAIFDVKILTLIIPSLVFIFYIIFLSNSHLVNVEAKACARIEARINKLVRRKAMDWESTIAPQMLRSIGTPSRISVASLCILAFCVFAYFSFQAFLSFGVAWLTINIVEFLVMATATLRWAFFEIRTKLPSDV